MGRKPNSLPPSLFREFVEILVAGPARSLRANMTLSKMSISISTLHGQPDDVRLRIDLFILMR